MKLKIVTVMLSLCASVSLMAQSEPWSLRRCVDYAIEHNIEIRRREITKEQRENDLSTARGSYLPTVGAYVNQNFDFGRGLTINNTYENKNTRNTSMGIQANMTLFNGLQTVNNVRESRLNLQAATEDLQAAKEDIGINVAQAYLQVLTSREIADKAHEQVALSIQQLERKEHLLSNGKASESEVYAARSLVAQDEMTAVKADGDYQLALLELSQLLELTSPDSLSVAQPDTFALVAPLPTPDEVYNDALTNKATIRAAQVRAESAERRISTAKGAYCPTLSLSAGIGTGYYAVAGQEGDSFGDQFSNNMDKSIFLSLSIPIFNRFASRNNIRSAKMSYSSSVIDLESARKTLYKEIQQAYYNAVAARSTYQSSVTAAESADAAFRLADAKYAAGLFSATDYAEARTNRLTALANRIQYKYDLIFRVKILEFYRGALME